MSGYEGDSFFTLTLAGRIGLLLLSLALAVGSLILSRYLCRNRPITLRLPIAVLVFWLFVWTSPQIYYAYYMTLFDGLPVQIVIKWPESPAQIWSLLTFSDRSNLSNHTKAILGWLLIIHSFFPIRNKAEEPQPDAQQSSN